MTFLAGIRTCYPQQRQSIIQKRPPATKHALSQTLQWLYFDILTLVFANFFGYAGNVDEATPVPRLVL
jgi:hypothetical protein